MKRLHIALLIALVCCGHPVLGGTSSPVVAFIGTLDEQQWKQAVISFTDSSREAWHYFPASMWPRAGIPLSELSPTQQNRLFDLLRAHLSETGYDKTRRIIDLENVLAERSGNPAMRDSEQYYAAFYGDPEKDTLWGWSFEGHHLSLNFTVAGGQVAMAPRFLGAHPATIPSGPRKGERTLAAEQDLGLALVNSMTPAQKEKAIFRTDAYREIITRNETEVEPLEPVGIRFNALDATQEELLLGLIREYLSAMPEGLARKRMDRLQKEGLDQIRFGWAGGTAAGEGHYYRIQGTTFLVEYDNTQNRANHIHSVWRDFNGDFGRNLIREHYAHGHRHE